ncbi:glycoside hydrolase family 65 protein [Streptomyces sp. HB2AG]|uniref:glycoside hydrolase family 65 protein n=1 Tax=Streptomyces sp. HB2AG TaxID=2983400 RepID=UPI0022AA3C2F|nr:glycosyl hydrolase family 65 protein [Streptomyces sp. HB2AG]MCZ2525042.1 glycoside hydrolase family 65 protein [Streptomyces sp. HB2AG]
MTAAAPPGVLRSPPAPEWTWEYRGYEPGEERLREALCTLGNGYFATRGAAPEAAAGPVHYPGTYVAGCYDRLVSTVAGRQVENEDMVNLPNWLPLRFRPLEGPGPAGPAGAAPADRGGAAPGTAEPAGAGRWISPDEHPPAEYHQCLDLRGGTLTRRAVFPLPGGGRLLVEQCRLVHMGDPHLAALRTVFTALDGPCRLEFESALDGAVTNAGVERYRDLAGDHLTEVRTGAADGDVLWLSCRTRSSQTVIAAAARTRVAGAVPEDPRDLLEELRAGRRAVLPLEPGRPVTVDKTVALHTSRDPAIGSPLRAAVDRVREAPGLPALLDTHRASWDRLWRRAELAVPGEAGRILRLHLFHVLQTLSPHTAELDVGVPARGLHGEAYRGHVFWDELFVLPYLNLHLPEVSRALLAYRHRRLPQACRAAAREGLRGAMYPWQSGSDGREETQVLHLNPRSGRWLPDHSRLQHHVGSAVAYNVWQYGQATGDAEFMHTKGAEIMVQVARFWADRATHDRAGGTYRILGVVGPDEYHDAYPDAARPGLDDNAYTNVTAAWVLARAVELVRLLPAPRRDDLFDRLGLDRSEPQRWEEISRGLRVPFHDGVVSQFEGYEDLAELDWAGYRARYGSIRRLDRILEAEGDTVNRYRASKQADVLMLGYLFPPRELSALFARLGHRMDDGIWRRTVEYYLRRTSHGSTLSSLVHGWVLARARRAEAWAYMQEALVSDVVDIQGGTTPEGIHLGAMGGTLDFVQRCLTGLETRGDVLWIDPVPAPPPSPELPHPSYELSVRHRGHWNIRLHMEGGRLTVTVPASEEPPLRIVLAGRPVTVRPGESCRLDLPA